MEETSGGDHEEMRESTSKRVVCYSVYDATCKWFQQALSKCLGLDSTKSDDQEHCTTPLIMTGSTSSDQNQNNKEELDTNYNSNTTPTNCQGSDSGSGSSSSSGAGGEQVDPPPSISNPPSSSDPPSSTDPTSDDPPVLAAVERRMPPRPPVSSGRGGKTN